MSKIVNKYTWKPEPPEENSGETLTESTGYRSPQSQIEAMIISGQRLQAARDSEFDFKAGEVLDEQFSDPTRSPNFDITDAQRLNESALSNLRAQQQAESQAVAAPTVISTEPDPKSV